MMPKSVRMRWNFWAFMTMYLNTKSPPTAWTATAWWALPEKRRPRSASRFHPPVVKETGNGEDIHDYLQVEVKDEMLCPRYCARMVKNIKIAPSPKWMQRRLAASGIRPINNIVDITNYVMEEYGQPMHAYDYDHIAGHKIIVKRAKDGD